MNYELRELREFYSKKYGCDVVPIYAHYYYSGWEDQDLTCTKTIDIYFKAKLTIPVNSDNLTLQVILDPR